MAISNEDGGFEPKTGGGQVLFESLKLIEKAIESDNSAGVARSGGLGPVFWECGRPIQVR